MKPKIRNVKVKDGVTYISVSQVIEDYLNNRSNVTEDAEFTEVKPLMIDAEKADNQKIKNINESGQGTNKGRKYYNR